MQMKRALWSWGLVVVAGLGLALAADARSNGRGSGAKTGTGRPPEGATQPSPTAPAAAMAASPAPPLSREPVYAPAGLFKRKETEPTWAGGPTAAGRAAFARLGLEAVAGVDPPLVVEPGQGGCLTVGFTVAPDGRATAPVLLDAVPGNDDHGRAALAAVTTWRFAASATPGVRVVRMVLAAGEGDGRSDVGDGRPAGACRLPEATSVVLMLRPGLRLQAQGPGIPGAEQAAATGAQPLAINGYPPHRLREGVQGCALVSFIVGPDGHPAEPELVRAWPAGDDAFATDAAGHLERLTLLGGPTPARSLAEFHYRLAAGEAAARPPVPAKACAPMG